MSTIELKHFRSEACLSWLVWEKASRTGALIDPVVELMDEYRAQLGENGIRLAWVIDTRTHVDHFSATHLVAEETRAAVALGEATRSERASRRLAPGDRLPLGAAELAVIATPGIAPDAICLLLDRPEARLLFTGDTLLIGSAGGTDAPGADPAALQRSLYGEIAALPGDTAVLPGHDHSDLLFSTLAHELANNPDLRIGSPEDFVRRKSEEARARSAQPGRLPPEAQAKVDYNLALSPRAHPRLAPRSHALAARDDRMDQTRSGSISPEKYRHKLETPTEGTLFLDVREPGEFAEGHIPGTRNLPLSSLPLELPSLRAARRIYVHCRSGRRGATAARTLSRLGLADVVNVSGGFQAWVQAGLPAAKGAK